MRQIRTTSCEASCAFVDQLISEMAAWTCHALPLLVMTLTLTAAGTNVDTDERLKYQKVQNSKTSLRIPNSKNKGKPGETRGPC
jgi:hypothetical protein